MIIILPLGHDRAITHFPYVTLGIVVLCTIIQAASCAIAQPEQEAGQRLMKEQELRSRIWREHGRKWAQQRVETLRGAEEGSQRDMMSAMKAIRRAYGDFFEEYEAGNVVERDDPDFRLLKSLAESRQQLPWPLSLGFRMMDLGSRPLALISYVFVHAGWFHLLGNMLFLYICGCNTEDRWGRLVWLLFFLAGGAVSALAFGSMHPDTEQPLVGASGAVAAAMGAFLVFHYKATINFWYVYFFFIYPRYGTFKMRAFWALPLWLLQQLLGLATESTFATVAYSAHVAGFTLGVVVALGLKMSGVDRQLVKGSEERATLYAQHPGFDRGMDLLDAGDDAGARQCFKDVLAQDKGNTAALVKLAGLEPDPATAADLASRAVMATRREGDRITPRSIYIDHMQRHPRAPLTDRALFSVAECFGDDAPQEAIAVYRVLLTVHGRSVMAPKAMLNVARIYRDLDNLDAARKALAAVRKHYPGSAFAEQADSLEQEFKAS